MKKLIVAVLVIIVLVVVLVVVLVLLNLPKGATPHGMGDVTVASLQR
jgi:preprotein translocase subunit SecG